MKTNFNITNKFVAIFAIGFLKAVRDAADFIWPEDFLDLGGWFSLWHISDWLLLLVVGINFINWSEKPWQKNFIKLVSFCVILYVTQLFFYNYLFQN